jgi:RNA polymerase sigma-70 factor (ECF subfamily)
MTWRLALDRQRANLRRARWELVHARQPAEPRAADPLIADERHTQIWAAIDALPEKLRLAVVLVNIEGHNLKEVGALLGVAEGTIKARLFAARQRLKEQLQWTSEN